MYYMFDLCPFLRYSLTANVRPVIPAHLPAAGIGQFGFTNFFLTYSNFKLLEEKLPYDLVSPLVMFRSLF